MKRMLLTLCLCLCACCFLAVSASAEEVEPLENIPSTPVAESEDFENDTPAETSAVPDPAPGEGPAPDAAPLDSPAPGADDLSADPVLMEEDTDVQVLELVPASEAEPSATIWDKPIEDYTPTEGYLFLLFVLAMAALFYRIFRKGVL